MCGKKLNPATALVVVVRQMAAKTRVLINEMAQYWADCYYNFDVDDTMECPMTTTQLYEDMRDTLKDSYGGKEADCHDNLMLLGAVSYGDEDNTWIDWDDLLEYVENKHDEWELSQAEAESESESESDSESESKRKPTEAELTALRLRLKERAEARKNRAEKN